MRTIQLGGALGVLLFGALGLRCLATGVRNVARARASADWPTAPGVVEAADVTVERTRTRSTSRAAERTQTDYLPEIRVRYAVAGVGHQTTTRRFGQLVGTGDPSDAELVVRRYPLGARVSVSYLPADPSIATVRPGFHADALWLPGAGLAFLAGALFFLPALAPRGLERGHGMPLVATLFSVCFCTIGVMMLVPGLRNVLRGRASAHGPTTPGVIVFGAEPPEAWSDDSASVPHHAGGDTLRISPRYGAVVYAYDAGGRRRYGNVRHFGQLAEADDPTRYPIARAVTVAYAPDDPELSTLEPGLAREAWVLPGAGAAFFGFGLAVLLVIVPAMRNRP